MIGNDIERTWWYIGDKTYYQCIKGALTLMLSFQLVGGRRIGKKFSAKDKNISKKRQMNKAVASSKRKARKN